MTDARCEPPEELRGVDGPHWIAMTQGERMVRWLPGLGCWLWEDAHHWPHEIISWRYLAPVATPAEVKALKAERDALVLAFNKLGTVLRVNMLRHGPLASHVEIDAAIDACLGPVARAALFTPPEGAR